MNNTTKQAKGYDSPLLLSLLEKTSPEAYERTCNRMMMAARIEDGMKAKGWNQTQFAEQIGQTPSTISKWLSGTNNFTQDILTDIQRVLGIQLLYLEEVKPIIKEVTKVEYKTVVFTDVVSGSEKSYERKLNYRQQGAVANA